MANDLKTMSDLFMGLMKGLDDDEDKKKGLIPGTNIPLPDPNSLTSPVMSQFQDIPQGPQMVPDSPQLFRSQMTVPELKQFKVPEKSTPPIVPYQDAGEYMKNYFASNQEALANREPIPRKDMLRSDGTTKSAQGFLGPFPDKYGKMMTEQTIGVEIDGKEVQMPAIVPTTTPDEIELLASGNVNWQSPRGQLIQDKAVANYRDRVSRGLSPYYQDGEGNVPSVQKVPKPVEVGGPAYSYGNLGVKPVSTVLDLNDPNLYDPSTGNLKPEYQKQAEAQFDPNNLVEVGGPAYSYGNLGVKPQREVPELPFSYNVEDILNKTPSDFIPKPEPTKLDSERRSLRITNESFIQPEQDIEGLISKQAGEDASDREDLVSGDLTVRQYERNKVKREEELANAREKQAIHERQTLGMLNQRVDQLEAAGLTEEANQVRSQIPKPKIPDSPMVGLGGVPELEPEPELEVKPPLKVVTTEETEASGELIGSDTSKKVDKNLKVSGVQSGGNVVTTTNTETGEEEVVVVDEKGDEKPGFLKGLWNGIKDIAKEGFEDPSLRRALFAYTASRVLGYDGVNLASAVLENEWQKQAAQAKADRELEKLYGEKQAKLILDKRVDPTKVFTVYDSQTKTNLTGSTSKDGTLFYPGNSSVFGVEAGQPIDLSKLRTFDDGRFKPQAGKTMAELQDKYLQFAQDRATAVIGQIKNRNSSMESKQLDDLVAQMQAATDPNILSEPLMTFLSTLPAGVDPNDEFVKQASVNGIREWLKSFESGQTVDSKDLVGFLEAQRMKLDLTSNGIPQPYFKIPADEKGEAQVGNNALSMIMNGIENSPYAKDLGLSTPIILSKMADIYGKKVINEKGFQSRMNGLSKDSFSKGVKSKFVSPFFAFVEKSFASDNEDIAELMAELKK